jgi:hypothetical protein
MSGYIVYNVQQCVDEVVTIILGGKLYASMIIFTETSRFTQVIMIARLHAMYQRSRKVLIILVVTFLGVRIVDAVMAILFMSHGSSGKPLLWMKDPGPSCSLTNTRGIHSLWHLSLHRQ